MELSSPASLAPSESSPVFPAHNRIGPVVPRADGPGYVVWARPSQVHGSDRSPPEGSVLVATPTTATPAGSPSPPDQPFDTVLRGYERRQVDDFVGRA